MGYANSYLEQLDYEATITRKFLNNLPEDQLKYKPAEKSMELQRLVGHIVELTDWVEITLAHNELDWASFKYIPIEAKSKTQILELFESKLTIAKNVLANTADETFKENWTMRKGDFTFFTMPKVAVLRNFVFNHFIHHRAQLSVYYRILGIKVPSSYGPSGDES
jgi:uncharacterized damage-inducible protein DinB